MAEALKSSAILWRFPNMDNTLNQTLHRLSVERVSKLDAAYGVATGLFASDEFLVAPPSANETMRKTPSHGTELCSVVESMFSYNEMFSIHGDELFADRAERITFNALPGAWASPRGGDMCVSLAFLTVCLLCHLKFPVFNKSCICCCRCRWNHQGFTAVNQVKAINTSKRGNRNGNRGEHIHIYGIQPAARQSVRQSARVSHSIRPFALCRTHSLL